MKRYLLVTTTLVIFVAGIVTLNLNSTVWAKDDYKSNSKDSFKMSEMINAKVNTQDTDNGDTETTDTHTTHNRNFQSTHGSNNCDSECRKTLDNVLGLLENP